MQQTSPTINEVGNRFYFDPDTMAQGKELGLDGFRFYFLGRGGVLGDVDPAVIVAAFGYFSPSVIEVMWDSAKQIMEPRAAARAYLACADRFGTARLGGLDVLDGFDRVKICTGYRIGEREYDYLPPHAADQAAVEPIYEDMPGWEGTTAGARSWADLPAQAIKYVRRIEELIRCPVALVSTSPDREDTILVRDPFAG